MEKLTEERLFEKLNALLSLSYSMGRHPEVIVMNKNTAKVLYETVAGRSIDDVVVPMRYRGIAVYRSDDVQENEFVIK